jgi:hypothetical protein
MGSPGCSSTTLATLQIAFFDGQRILLPRSILEEVLWKDLP